MPAQSRFGKIDGNKKNRKRSNGFHNNNETVITYINIGNVGFL